MMESVPAIDLEQLPSDLLAVRGTERVYDMRVWCIARSNSRSRRTR
jgi:hypothetical protein